MQGFVKIKSGSYRNQEVKDEVFPLIKQFQLGSKGGYITVDGTGRFGKDKIRVTVATPTDYELVDVPTTVEATDPALDEQRMTEIAERFDILNDMTKAVLNGDIRAMIVAGPPGVGKSFGIEGELERANLKPPAPKPKTPKDAARRKSFCSRMKGMREKNTSPEVAKDPNSRINKSLRAWNC